MDSLEAITRVDFAIRQVNGALDQLVMWMAGKESSLEAVSHHDRCLLGANFFVDNPEHLLIYPDYLKLVHALNKLTRDHAEFIAGHCQGDTTAMREEMREAISTLAGILDGLGKTASAAQLRALPGMA